MTRSTRTTSSSSAGLWTRLLFRHRSRPTFAFCRRSSTCNLHLERIGDQAVNVAKLYLVTQAEPGSAAMRQQIAEMGEHRGGHGPDRDGGVRTAGPRALPEAPDRWTTRSIDLNRATHLEALKLADDRRSLDWGMHMNMAARALERVGDNAVDIGEQVGFLITGEFREFTDASHPVDVLEADDGRRRPHPDRRGRGVPRGLGPLQPRAGGVRRHDRARRPSRAGTVPGRAAVPRDPGSDAAGGVGTRPVPCHPRRVRRPDHHGDRQGLRGRQGDGAGARGRRLRHQAVLGPRARFSCPGAAAPDAAPSGRAAGRRARRRTGGDGRRPPRGRGRRRDRVVPAQGVRAARDVPAQEGSACSRATS